MAATTMKFQSTKEGPEPLYVISGLKSAKSNHECESGGEDLECQNEYLDEDDDEIGEDDKLIPFLCYSLVVTVSATLGTGILFPLLLRGLGVNMSQQTINVINKFFIAMLLGEVGGILLSICFLGLCISCNCSWSKYLKEIAYEVYFYNFSNRAAKEENDSLRGKLKIKTT